MLRKSALLTAVGLLVSTPLAAAEWHHATDVTVQPVPGGAQAASPSAVARSYLGRHEATLRLSDVTLVEARRVVGASFSTERYTQEHDGLPVIGGQAAVRVGADGQVKAVVLNVARDLSVTTVPSIGARVARELAASRAGLTTAANSRARLAVLPDGAAGRLIWEVDVPTLDGGRRFWVDAHDARILHDRALAVHALGTVYPISSVTTPDTQDLELVDLDVASPQRLNGWNGNLTVTNYVSGDSQSGDYFVEQIVGPSQGDDFLYPPPLLATDATDAFAQVSVFYHLTRMRDFATQTLGVDMSASSWKLVAVANLQEGGSAFDNAFYSPGGIGAPFSAPNLIGIGQGAMFDYAQDSDVFNHEFTHYLTGNAIGYNGGDFHLDSWGLSHFSGAIDEGISDYFACTVNGDPLLGEASLALIGLGRDLSNTSKRCPEDLRGEVHDDGEIIGSVSWSLREALSPEVADPLVWGAVSLLTLGAPFGDFANGLLQTADDMVAANTMTPAEAALIPPILAARGLDECGHELTIDGSRDANLQGLGQFCGFAKQEGFYRQSMFHFVVTAGEAARGLSLGIELRGLQPGDDPNWNLYVRKDEHVAFDVAFPPTVQAFDHALTAQTTPNGKLVIDETSDPPFEPGATYHLVITHQQCSNSIAEITASNLVTAPGTGGMMGTGGSGGMGGDMGDDSAPIAVEGCGCRAAPSESPAWGWLAVVVGIACWRRRRRDRLDDCDDVRD